MKIASPSPTSTVPATTVPSAAVRVKSALDAVPLDQLTRGRAARLAGDNPSSSQTVSRLATVQALSFTFEADEPRQEASMDAQRRSQRRSNAIVRRDLGDERPDTALVARHPGVERRRGSAEVR